MRFNSDSKLSSQSDLNSNEHIADLNSPANDAQGSNTINEKTESGKLNEKPLIENSHVVQQNFSPLLRQIFATSGPLIATICSGLTAGYSAILLPQLQHENSTISITTNEASWIASMAALPMAVGCLLAGALMARFGRKITNIIVCVMYLVGWLLIIFATSVVYLLIGRLFTGLAAGLLGPPSSVYIAEVTTPKYRGIFLAIISFSISLGILGSHLLGTFLTWKTTAIICGVLPILCIILIALSPETPNYLASKGYLAEAESTFRWLRGNNLETLEEMEELLRKYKKLFKERRISESMHNSTTSSVALLNLTVCQKLTKSYFWKPLLIMNAFFAITQCSGINAIIFYSVDIIKDTLGQNFNSYLAMAIIDVTRLIMSVIACILLRKVSRRMLAVFSTAGTALVLIFLTVFIYFVDFKNKTHGLEYVPLICLVLYIGFTSAGLVPLPWVMVGEVFPSVVRNIGTGLCTSMCFIYFFTVVKTGPLLFGLGAHYAYGVYGAVAFVGTIILYLYLPETKDKTLEEIEARWMRRNSRT